MPFPSSGAARRLWRDIDFRRLWLGQTASQLGAQASQVTLPLIAVLALNADADQVGVLRAAEQLPILLFSLLAGAWVDRRRARDVMVLADALRALVLAAVPVVYVLGLPALLVAGFLVGALSVFFDVAYHASLVRLVRREQLIQGNGALESSRSAAQIAGPALGGAMVSLLSAPFATLASAFFFAGSFLSIRRIRRSESLPERPSRFWPQIREGLHLVARDPSLRAVGVASGLYQFFFAALMTVYLLFLPRELHLSGAAIGLALAATGPGAVVGALLSTRLPGRFGYGRVLTSFAVLADVVMLGVPALHGTAAVTIPLLMAVNFVFGVSSQTVNVTAMAVRQAITPVHLQGRVVVTINFAGLGLSPLGSLLGGHLAGVWGLRPSLLVTAIGLGLSPLFMAFSPLARLGRTLPAPRPWACYKRKRNPNPYWSVMSKDRFFLLDQGASRPTRVPLPPRTSVKAGVEDTQGRFSLLEQHADGDIPAHSRDIADEFVYVVGGELGIEYGGATHRLTPGMCALLPRGVTRAMRDLGGQPVHTLRLSAPGAQDVPGREPQEWGDRERFYVLGKGEARPGRIALPPAFSVKARTGDTDGLFSLLEVTVAQPVPRHTHHVADECVYVLDGELLIDFDDRTHTAGAGQFVLLPHGVPHAIRPGSNPPPKVIQISSPGGWECVVEALIEHRSEVSRAGRFDPAALNRHTRRYHVVYEGAYEEA